MKFTGLVCQECKRPVVQVEHQTPTAMTFRCEGCGTTVAGSDASPPTT